MVMLLKSGSKVINDTTNLFTVKVLLSRALGIFTELLEATFHRLVLGHVGFHETWKTCSLLDFWEIDMLLGELVMVDEIIDNAAVVEEISCLLCSWDDSRYLLVDCVEGAEESVMCHGHDLGILNAVVIVREFGHG